ncbi:hypothetical protein GE300_19255 [Rhodobacteraceae bacterium 2CG4]|uniref:HNH endonuclease n=1 Tax=Halovulum marinum TaxID=2662447 RepID=A0A6L5Z6J5_9RHOB|nr:hypothetical protein [Halovulum marinum]MSU91720.1 hypothetical protein [Halovulum marinum]
MKSIHIIYFVVLAAIISPTKIQAQQQAQQCDHEFSRPSYKNRGSYCAVGQLVEDQYTIGKKIKCEDIEVDHLISLYYAYSQGICGDDLKRLANDPRNLRFTHRKTNRAKGAKSPEEFASTLPSQLAETVALDANGLRSEYKLKPISHLTNDQRNSLLVEELEDNKREISRLGSVSPEVRARMVRYKGEQMPLSDAVNEHTTAVRRRLVASAQRNFGAMPAEALPWFGISVVLAATAWEMADLCEALKDNYDLAIAFNPDLQRAQDVDQICAIEIPKKEELFEQMAAAPADIWDTAKKTYKNIDAAAPSVSDAAEYMTTVSSSIGTWMKQAGINVENFWEKALNTADELSEQAGNETKTLWGKVIRYGFPE